MMNIALMNRLFLRVRSPVLMLLFCGFFMFILWIIYAADTGADNVFINGVRMLPYGDKLGHVVLYGGLALLLNWLLAPRSLAMRFLRIPLGSVLIFMFAIIEEASQGFFATRSLDGWDIAADFIGIGCAAIMVKGKYKRERDVRDMKSFVEYQKGQN